MEPNQENTEDLQRTASDMDSKHTEENPPLPKVSKLAVENPQSNGINATGGNAKKLPEAESGRGNVSSMSELAARNSDPTGAEPRGIGHPHPDPGANPQAGPQIQLPNALARSPKMPKLTAEHVEPVHVESLGTKTGVNINPSAKPEDEPQMTLRSKRRLTKMAEGVQNVEPNGAITRDPGTNLEKSRLATSGSERSSKITKLATKKVKPTTVRRNGNNAIGKNQTKRPQRSPIPVPVQCQSNNTHTKCTCPSCVYYPDPSLFINLDPSSVQRNIHSGIHLAGTSNENSPLKPDVSPGVHNLPLDQKKQTKIQQNEIMPTSANSENGTQMQFPIGCGEPPLKKLRLTLEQIVPASAGSVDPGTVESVERAVEPATSEAAAVEPAATVESVQPTTVELIERTTVEPIQPATVQSAKSEVEPVTTESTESALQPTTVELTEPAGIESVQPTIVQSVEPVTSKLTESTLEPGLEPPASVESATVQPVQRTAIELIQESTVQLAETAVEIATTKSVELTIVPTAADLIEPASIKLVEPPIEPVTTGFIRVEMAEQCQNSRESELSRVMRLTDLDSILARHAFTRIREFGEIREHHERRRSVLASLLRINVERMGGKIAALTTKSAESALESTPVTLAEPAAMKSVQPASIQSAEAAAGPLTTKSAESAPDPGLKPIAVESVESATDQPIERAAVEPIQQSTVQLTESAVEPFTTKSVVGPSTVELLEPPAVESVQPAIVQSTQPGVEPVTTKSAEPMIIPTTTDLIEPASIELVETTTTGFIQVEMAEQCQNSRESAFSRVMCLTDLDSILARHAFTRIREFGEIREHHERRRSVLASLRHINLEKVENILATAKDKGPQ